MEDGILTVTPVYPSRGPNDYLTGYARLRRSTFATCHTLITGQEQVNCIESSPRSLRIAVVLCGVLFIKVCGEEFGGNGS